MRVRRAYCLDLRHTAIDADFAAVHEGGVVGGEKCSHRCDLFGSPQFLAWNCRSEVLLCFWRKVYKNVGSDRPRTKDVYANPALRKFHCPRSCERPKRRLASGINAQPWHALEVSYRTIHDDRSTVAHQRQCLLHSK